MPNTFQQLTGILRLQHLIGLTSENVIETCAELVALVEHKHTPWKLVTHELNPVPNSSTWLQLVCELLADAALQVWPHWSPALTWDANHDRGWQQFASRLARQGERPLSAQFSRSYQLRRLSRALAAENLAIAILIPAQQVDDQRLLGLAKGAEWLAREANACVLMVVDHSLADRSALDSLPFENWIYQADRSADSHATDRQIGAEKSTKTAGIDSTHITAPACKAIYPASQEVPKQVCSPLAMPALDERKLVHPCLGRPHPGSPGEQQLYAALEATPSRRAHQWTSRSCRSFE